MQKKRVHHGGPVCESATICIYKSGHLSEILLPGGPYGSFYFSHRKNRYRMRYTAELGGSLFPPDTEPLSLPGPSDFYAKFEFCAGDPWDCQHRDSDASRTGLVDPDL